MLSGGCARRQPLDRADLARIDAEDPDRASLRVHLARRLIVVHPALESDAALAVAGGVIDERRTDRRLRVIVGKRRAGAVIAASEDGRELWVSFDPECLEITCAYGFIAVDGEAFRLAAVPGRDRHRPPRSYRGREAERARLEPHLIDPAIDGSEILAIDRRGRLRTIDLEIRKRSRKQVRSATERARGFDRR
ncbi:MAG: hypothetical protein H6711_10075 [Myxococcales bacterium]|nr:hypothetical protein [Myxococcales bacterium]